MRTADIDPAAVYAAPNGYGATPGRVVATGQLWTLDRFIVFGGIGRLRPTGKTRQTSGAATGGAPVGHLAVTISGSDIRALFNGDADAAADALAALDFTGVADSLERVAQLSVELREQGIRLHIENTTQWSGETWAAHKATEQKNREAAKAAAADKRRAADERIAAWAPIAARLETLGIGHHANPAANGTLQEGDVTSVTITVAMMAKLLDSLGAPADEPAVPVFHALGRDYATLLDLDGWKVIDTETRAVLVAGRQSAKEAESHALADIMNFPG